MPSQDMHILWYYISYHTWARLHKRWLLSLCPTTFPRFPHGWPKELNQPHIFSRKSILSFLNQHSRALKGSFHIQTKVITLCSFYFLYLVHLLSCDYYVSSHLPHIQFIANIVSGNANFLVFKTYTSRLRIICLCNPELGWKFTILTNRMTLGQMMLKLLMKATVDNQFRQAVWII